eukprot:CAMPEP_0175194538 /NCGR_PEP_ID=MMETSP0093-20121207/6543_1 /TAXON_ID=311494 /ORGANISM="Alexandrium monilatum, Strain CCMP3105" /LENGTH=437 /DNA_ID=CAMNT_0016487463 /DNA_START=66 /DNA_END=1379 /DNA_ORIENTATION=+
MTLRCQRSLADGGPESTRVFSEVGRTQEDIAEALTMASLDEIRRLTNPPMPVRRTLEVVHLVLHAQQYWRGVPPEGVKWERVQRTISSDDFVQRLQRFDMEALRQLPNLAHDLHQVYFSADAGGPRPRRSLTVSSRLASKGRAFEALSPERVRHASSAAAALFSWAARTVQQAAPDPADEPRRLRRSMSVPERSAGPGLGDSPASAAAELPALDELASPAQRADAAEEGQVERQRLTVGVWLTCPQGHGLDIGCIGPSPVCAICSSSIVRGGDSAACRTCRFFVCVDCRRGGWLSVSVSEGNRQEAPMGLLDFDVVGFRWLRSGESLPEPLRLEDALARRAMACWGRDGPPDSPGFDGQLRLELRAGPAQASDTSSASPSSLLCDVAYRRNPRSGSSARASSAVFGLTDARALGASVLLALCGWPGADLGGGEVEPA